MMRSMAGVRIFCCLYPSGRSLCSMGRIHAVRVVREMLSAWAISSFERGRGVWVMRGGGGGLSWMYCSMMGGRIFFAVCRMGISVLQCALIAAFTSSSVAPSLSVRLEATVSIIPSSS